MALGRFAEARAKYWELNLILSREITQNSANKPLKRALQELQQTVNRRLDLAEAVAEAAEDASKLPRGKTRPLTREDAALVQIAIINSTDPQKARRIMREYLPHLEDLPTPYAKNLKKGTSGKKAVVTYVTDPNGGVLRSSAGNASYRQLAIVKELADGDVDGIAEEIASRVFESAGRRGPFSRVIQLTIDGKPRRFLVTKTFDPGVDWDDLGPGVADLIARKEDLAEDLVYRLLLGDGDVHLGNFRILDTGHAMGFDYGGADLFPTHPTYRDPVKFKAAADQINQYRAALKDMLENPGNYNVSRETVEKASRALEQTARAMNVDPLDGLEIPYVSFENGKKAAGELAEAFRALGREELPADKVAGLFNDGYVRGLYQHPRFTGNPMEFTDDQLDDFIEATMHTHYNHAVNQWGDEAGIVQSVITQEDCAHALEAIQNKVRPNIDTIVDTSMKGATEAQRAYTKKLLRKRMDLLERFLKKKFPSIPATSCIHPQIIPSEKHNPFLLRRTVA